MATTNATAIGLSEDALYEMCRSLADRGEDYGWNVYYRGVKVRRSAVSEDGGDGWLDAFKWSLAAFKSTTGKDWRY